MKLQQAPGLINLIFSYYQEEQTKFAIFNSEILTY